MSETINYNYLAELNLQQREAVEYTEGPSLVIAGAGSGKTRVLTYKIVHLLRHGFEPYRILALTFTNKAAKEMKERIQLMVGPKVSSKLMMGTFHSIFLSILRRHVDRIGYKNGFTIYNPSVTSNTLNDSQNNTYTQISKITIGNSSTIIELTLKNYLWCSIEPSTYIVANGQRYTMQRAEGIAVSPQKTYPSRQGADIICRLYFPSIPKNTRSIDLIEDQSSRWKFYGIKIR